MTTPEPKRPSLTRLGRGRYATKDGLFLIESDCPSLGDRYDLQGNTIAYEAERASEWFVYDATDPRVQRGDYGPPDALRDGFDTLREASAWATQKDS